MKTRTLNIILLIFIWLPIFGQTNLLVPKKGIIGIPVVLDSTNISEVIEIYGNEYSVSNKTLAKYFRFEKLGLTFQIDPFDKNKIIRSISVESPFQAKTENGIVLNKSTMKEVWALSGSKGCFTSKTYAYNSQEGISYYIKRYPKDKKGYNPDDIIYKIEVNNDNKFGSSSRVNFEFNNEPIKKKTNELISILKSDNFTFQKLTSYWEQEKKSENEHFGLEKRKIFERNIDNNLTQENIEIRMVGTFYELNIIKSNDELIYLKLTDTREDKTVLERIENVEFAKTDFDLYTYGTFCSVDGASPDRCQEMLWLVKDNNYKQLAQWLTSINPETATYGYIGINFLQRRGIDILPAEIKTMERLRKSEIQLYTCQGCAFGVRKKISEILTKKNLKRTYKAFEKSGWLK